MKRRRLDFALVLLSASFLIALLVANFFHTEKGPRQSSSCPACQFQQTSIAAGVVPVFNLPPLLLFGILPLSECLPEIPVFGVCLSNRSPPVC